MMNAKQIRETIEAGVNAMGLFIVDVTVSADNDITVEIESEEGIVDMDKCVSVNNMVLDAFDRDVEDYALTVTSAGLDMPFKVLKQYLKAVGSQVEVHFKGGKKITGVLTAADEESITLSYTAKEAVEGKKKKEMVSHEDRFEMGLINYVYPHIDFE